MIVRRIGVPPWDVRVLDSEGLKTKQSGHMILGRRNYLLAFLSLGFDNWLHTSVHLLRRNKLYCCAFVIWGSYFYPTYNSEPMAFLGIGFDKCKMKQCFVCCLLKMERFVVGCLGFEFECLINKCILPKPVGSPHPAQINLHINGAQ